MSPVLVEDGDSQDRHVNAGRYGSTGESRLLPEGRRRLLSGDQRLGLLLAGHNAAVLVGGHDVDLVGDRGSTAREYCPSRWLAWPFTVAVATEWATAPPAAS